MTSGNVRLLPMTDDIGLTVVEHGERGDLDPFHPEACLCGRYDYYLLCPDWGGWLDITIEAFDSGRTEADDAR